MQNDPIQPDNGLQPERTFLSLERSFFSYLLVNFTLFKVFLNSTKPLFIISVFIIILVNIHYLSVLSNFREVIQLQKNRAFKHRVILLSSALINILLALFFLLFILTSTS